MSAAYQSLLLEKIAYGSFGGEVTPLLINGANAALTTTYDTIWDESNLYVFLATNMSSPTVSSASANDTSAGTGARTVRIYGVNSAFAAVTEDKTLNGQTGVAITTGMMSINKIEVLTAGSGGVNAGIIYVGTGTVTAGKPAVVHGVMAAGRNMTTSFIYTVPSGYSLLMLSLDVESREVSASENEFVLEEIVNLGLKKTRFVHGFNSLGGPYIQKFDLPMKFAEKSQIQLKMLASTGDGPGYASANCLLINDATKTLF